MGNKTRSSSELKSIITDVFKNTEFQKLFSDVIMDNIAQVLKTELSNKLEEANKEISLLKDEVRALRSEIRMMKTQDETVENQSNDTVAIKSKPTKTIDNINRQSSGEFPHSEDKIDQASTDYNQGEHIDIFTISKKSNNHVSRNSNKPSDCSTTQRRNAQISKASADRSNGQLIGMAKPKKGWLYVGSISNKDATTEMVFDYLKVENIPRDEITIEKLTSKGQNSSFMVGIPFDKLEKIGNPDYWPRGVSAGRYNFWKKPKNDKAETAFLEK